MKTITAAQALEIVNGIRDILYSEPQGEGKPDTLNPEKEWQGDTIEYVAGTLHDAGLVPNEEEPLEAIHFDTTNAEQTFHRCDKCHRKMVITWSQDHNAHAITSTCEACQPIDNTTASIDKAFDIPEPSEDGRKSSDAYDEEELKEENDAMRALLTRCENFIAGFEDDDMQEGIAELLADIRTATKSQDGEQDAD